MHCSRCQGLMVKDQLLDMKGGYGQMWATSLRCVNCGRIQDSVIEHNRQVRQEKASVLSSGKPDYQDDEVHLGVESFIRKVA